MVYNRPTCNCPDASHKLNKNLFSNYNSSTFDRNWKTKTNSTGQQTNFQGIRERGYYCEHEFSVMRLRGEVETAFPSGVPYEPPITPLPTNQNTYNQIYESDFLYLKPISKLI